jgi:hypothetical protein
MSKEQLIEEKAEGIVNRFLASDFVANVKLVSRTAKRVILIVVPLGISTYLLHTQADKLVLALGVALGLVGVLNILTTAYTAEKLATKPKRR